MIFWCLMGLAFLGIVNQVVRNRRIDRYNRNVDRHNRLMEQLMVNKDKSTDEQQDDDN
jgi:hypothetical protein